MATRAGRPWRGGTVTVAADDAATARDIAASCVAWYLSAMGGVYARSVAGQGYPAEVAAVIAANPRPSPQRGTVPPDARAVLDQLAACEAGAQVREQAGRWDHAADVVMILLPPGLPWSIIEATLRAAAPAGSPGLERDGTERHGMDRRPYVTS